MTMNQKTNFDNFFITYQFLNGDNWGSSFANKEYQICYCVVDTDLITAKTKKVIGCFINPNDLILEEDKNDIDKHIYYFQRYIRISDLFGLKELLPYTIYSKTYSNTITKKILFESRDVTVIKIINKCKNLLKEKVLIR